LSIPLPLTFQRVTGQFTVANVLKIVADGGSDRAILQAAAAWPNGDGYYTAGWLALMNSDYATAIPRFQAALTAPSLIDCRRPAALALTMAHAADNRARHVPDFEVVPILKTDLDRVISLGGVHPEENDYEAGLFQVATRFGLYPQVRTLALLWLSRAPDDARAMYFLAVADSHLGDSAGAAALYQRALAMRLPGGMRPQAQHAIQDLTAPPATRPTTIP
jgi:hypothetical protein